MNLLQETIEAIQESGHVPENIEFIGSLASGHCCTWREFETLADREYSDGYGGQEVAKDLVIAFTDDDMLDRREYDGSEWWCLIRKFKTPGVELPIRSLFGGVWCSLDDIHRSLDSEGD